MEKKLRKDHRVVLYVKDICNITGRKYRTCWNLYQEILRAFEKQPGQYITVQEFSLYTGINEELVQGTLK